MTSARGRSSRGWRHDTAVQSDSTIHVWPDADGIDHDLIGTCICGPRLEEQNNGRVLVIHHSIDGRELTEPQDDEP